MLISLIATAYRNEVEILINSVHLNFSPLQTPPMQSCSP